MKSISKGGEPTRCPRCGGEPAPPRGPTVKSPFMTKSTKLVCILCGLDYEKGDPPWKPGDPPERGGAREPKK